MQTIGVGIAYSTFKLGTSAAYSEKMLAAQPWMCAAFAVVAFTMRFVNFYPMAFKEKVMKGPLREEIGVNMRSNPYVYKSVGASKEIVIFENDGLVGMYNRANRSLTHMIENAGSVVAGLLLAGGVFPFPTFVCACAFSVGRVMHQTGYSGGYGKHGMGFMVSTLGTVALEGLVILIALAGFGFLSVEAAATAPALEERIATLEASLAAALAAK